MRASSLSIDANSGDIDDSTTLVSRAISTPQVLKKPWISLDSPAADEGGCCGSARTSSRSGRCWDSARTSSRRLSNAAACAARCSRSSATSR